MNPIKENLWPWSSSSTLTASTTLLVVLFSILTRNLISLGPYSGQSTPPRYGDYEAQRHWMELTLNLPVREWYRNSSTFGNDLSYWGLDYPPLTAYQSFVHGYVVNSTVPEAIKLVESRGFESYESKLILRWTVISSDIIIFFPAAVWFVYVYCQGRVEGSAPWLLTMILLNPGLILIDHGHFQYNCISLGLTLAAIAAVFSNHELIAAFLYSLAINHKQMSIYFAPAFFSHLLGKCLKRNNPILEIIKLGSVVLATFAIVWWPYLYSMDAIKEVLTRLAPFERGIYEDYVANFWCTTSVLVKWKRLFSIPCLKTLSLFATVSSFIPSLIQQIKAPSNDGFLYALLNSSFAFYLLSYQVHEKSILMPLLPATLLANQEPLLFGWTMVYALLSMFPLIFRDGLVVQYVALLALFGTVFYSDDKRSKKKCRFSGKILASMFLSLFCALALHVMYLLLDQPERYPFLFEAMIMSLCFSQFVILTCYTNVKQWMLGGSTWNIEEKKNI